MELWLSVFGECRVRQLCFNTPTSCRSHGGTPQNFKTHAEDLRRTLNLMQPGTVTVKKKLNSNFVRWNKTQLKSSSSIVVDVGKKSTSMMSSIPAVKTTTRSTSAGRNFVALSFLVKRAIFQRLPQNSRDSRSGSRQFHSVDPYCWMDCTVRKKDRRLECAKSKNRGSSTWRKNPVRRLLSDSRPLQLRRYLPRCEDWQNYIGVYLWLTEVNVWERSLSLGPA